MAVPASFLVPGLSKTFTQPAAPRCTFPQKQSFLINLEQHLHWNIPRGEMLTSRIAVCPHGVNQQVQLPYHGALQPQGVLREVGEAQEPPFHDL